MYSTILSQLVYPKYCQKLCDLMIIYVSQAHEYRLMKYTDVNSYVKHGPDTNVENRKKSIITQGHEKARKSILNLIKLGKDLEILFWAVLTVRKCHCIVTNYKKKKLPRFFLGNKEWPVIEYSLNKKFKVNKPGREIFSSL